MNEPIKVCPKCGKVMSYNSWFHAYLCPYCDSISYTNRTSVHL